jgi:hypothetical protein
VLFSLLAAMSAAAVGLFVVSRREMNWWQAIAGIVIAGGGIAALHYLGRAALRGAALIVRLPCRWKTCRWKTGTHRNQTVSGRHGAHLRSDLRVVDLASFRKGLMF